jgi:hypothetical protein
MDEPKRLVEDTELSPLGRSLLASATTDAPEPGNRAATAKRLGIVALTLVGGSETGSALAASALWWKAGAVIALVGGVIAIAIVTRTPSEEPAAPVASPSYETRVVAPAPAPAVEPAAPVPVVEPVEPAPSIPAKPPVRRTAPIRRVEAPAPVEPPAEPLPIIEEPTPAPVVTAPPPAPVDPRRLAAEVGVLDRARGALRRGDSRAALAALDEHRRDFHDGALVAEAEVVRLEIFVQTDQVAAARDQARSFLSRFPHSPLVRRVRSIVDRMKEAP